MKKYYSLLLLLISSTAFCQDDIYKEPSKESQAYHTFRTTITKPSYGLIKIQGQIAKIKPNDDDERIVNKQFYQSLSLREKFTYNMVHAESFSQNCDAIPPIQDEQKKIFAHLPDAFDEYNWSDAQIDFLKNNRDSVIVLMKEIISHKNLVGVNFKKAIVEINAKEMIPFLISTYMVAKKDHDILTVLMLLMSQNKYLPFVSSASYKKLYSDETNYYSWLQFNEANEALIIKRATDFHNGFK
ncbi:MAG: hypothetical protein QM726_24260 [Chitinophagaceae bacterium]